tara:strand:- start:3577 stop:4089 length:513 start_codon:yes stop_codon:yes gene_type:complete
MNTIKKKPTPNERKEITLELRKKHQSIFDDLGIKDAAFVPKMAYVPKELDEVCMGFFENELLQGDLYTEKVSMSMESEDSSRTLYKVSFNKFYKDEYSTSPPNQVTGNVRYYIPLSEMEIVEKLEIKEFNLTDPDEDMPMDQMTMRDLAALLLKKPVSKKKWLNEIIKNQ